MEANWAAELVRPSIPVDPNTGVPGYNAEIGERTRKMAWSLTINSNVPSGKLIPSERLGVMNDLQGAVDWFFHNLQSSGSEDFLDIFRVYVRGRNRDTGTFLKRRMVQRITWAPGVVETGHPRGQVFQVTGAGGNTVTKTSKGYGNRIHYHGVLSVYHYSNIRLDTKRLTRYLNSMLTMAKDHDVFPQPNTGFRNFYILGVNVFARSFVAREDAFNRFQYANKERYKLFDQLYFAGLDTGIPLRTVYSGDEP